MVPTYSEFLTAAEFLRLYDKDRDDIESARPVPAPLGSRHFGHIFVVRRRPIYRPLTRRFV